MSGDSGGGPPARRRGGSGREGAPALRRQQRAQSRARSRHPNRRDLIRAHRPRRGRPHARHRPRHPRRRPRAPCRDGGRRGGRRRRHADARIPRQAPREGDVRRPPQERDALCKVLRRQLDAAAAAAPPSRHPTPERTDDAAADGAAGGGGGGRGYTYERFTVSGLSLLVRCKHDALYTTAAAAAGSGAAAAPPRCSLKASAEYWYHGEWGAWEEKRDAERARGGCDRRCGRRRRCSCATSRCRRTRRRR